MKRIVTIICAALIGATICGCHSSKHHHKDKHDDPPITRYDQRNGHKRLSKPNYLPPPPPPSQHR